MLVLLKKSKRCASLVRRNVPPKSNECLPLTRLTLSVYWKSVSVRSNGVRTSVPPKGLKPVAEILGRPKSTGLRFAPCIPNLPKKSGPRWSLGILDRLKPNKNWFTTLELNTCVHPSPTLRLNALSVVGKLGGLNGEAAAKTTPDASGSRPSKFATVRRPNTWSCVEKE